MIIVLRRKFCASGNSCFISILFLEVHKNEDLSTDKTKIAETHKLNRSNRTAIIIPQLQIDLALID